MTTLNTIIEEEKEVREKIGVIFTECFTKQARTWKDISEELDTLLTAAMQRAYEVGREENPLKGERRRIIEQIREERDAYWKEGLLQSIKETNFLKDMDKIEGDRGIVVYRRMRDHIEAFTLITNKDNLK